MEVVKSQVIVSKWIVCIGVIIFSMGVAHANEEVRSMRMLDFVVMNDAYGIKERNHYEEKVKPIAVRYGMTIERAFDISTFLAGSTSLADVVRLNIWKVPKGAMKKLSGDMEYQALVEYRNRVHDMNAVSIFMAELDDIGGTSKGTILIDLVVMNTGFDVNDRDLYEQRVAPITQKYGMSRFASYDIKSKKMGVAPDAAVRLNLWNIESPEKMKLVGEDPLYQALLPTRNKIHNMNEVSLFFAKEVE